MFNIINWCNQQQAPSYSKITTYTNDPSITKKMRYSQYIKTTKHRKTPIIYAPPFEQTPIPLYTLPAGQIRPSQL